MKILTKTVIAGTLALTLGLFVSCASTDSASTAEATPAETEAVAENDVPATVYILNASNLTAGEFADGAKVGDADYFTLNIPNAGESPLTIDQNNKSANDMRFNQRLKLGGTANSLSFTMASAGTVNIACMSSSSSSDRNLLFLQDGNEVTSVKSPGKYLAYSTVDLAAGTYTLQSTGGGGTNIYYIEVIEK